MSPEPRRVDQVKDAAVESDLAELNERLAGFGEAADARVERPVLLIVGHQRSGSTLVSQYLSAGAELGYPSNLVARLWRAPVAGVLLQNALAGTLGEPTHSFTSEIGTTGSLLEPHEFSYFWNHWFPGERECLDAAGFVRAVGSLERAFGRPLVFKNVLNSLRVELLAELLPTAVFLWSRRNLLDVACSTLDARRKRFGDDRAWLGVVPEACRALSDRPAPEQIAAQIGETERRLREAAEALSPGRVVEVDYDAFCARPVSLLSELEPHGIERRAGADLPGSFEARAASAGHTDADALAEALRAFDPELLA